MPNPHVFQSQHAIIAADSRSLKVLADQSIDLVVTSPPYPMIAMWDSLFSGFDAEVKKAFESQDGILAFELSHLQLDRVWQELWRVVKEGSLVCINIGDATRSIAGQFSLFPNQARITMAMQKIGFSVLPSIIWKKPTNSPNKFMGSGMLAACAYVTLEHEYILIFRKGGKREFGLGQESLNRQRSSFFWEERNVWFSDQWELKGLRQKLPQNATRERSAAYVLELPWRLIQMYSCYTDTVLDPFAGTGTTSLAAAVSARNSIAIEYEQELLVTIMETLRMAPSCSQELTKRRLQDHIDYIKKRQEAGLVPKYFNDLHKVSVATRQESRLVLTAVNQITERQDGVFEMRHTSI